LADEKQKILDHLWFREMYTGRNVGLIMRIERMIYSKKNDIQRIDVFDHPDLGRVFVLDGMNMLTEKDEFMYHEMLVHVPMFSHPNPKKVLVIGGGDGGSVREVLKHDCVENVILCEVDKDVIETAKKYLPTGVELDNPKLKIVIANGAEYVKNFENEFDVIIIDSTDPTAGEGGHLFTEEFYANCRKALKKGGVLSAETESPFYDYPWLKMAYERMKKSFKLVKVYMGFMATYPSGCWSYLFASDEIDPLRDFDPDRVKKFNRPLKYYNEEIHVASFALPNFVREIIE